MRASAFSLIILTLLSGACAKRQTAPSIPGPELRYYVKAASNPGLLSVTLVAENLRSDSLDFTFPVWLPGDYRPIEPGKWVEDVRGYDRATTELPVRRLGPNAWRIYPRGAPYFLISYTLHPVRPDGFKRSLISELTPQGGYFTGTVAFGYLKGLESHPLTLTFEFPAGAQAICTLEEDGPGRYRAANSFELAQTGCAYGPRMREFKENVRGVPHRLVLVAPPGFRADSLMEVVEDVAEAQSQLFRRPAYPAYTFFVHLVEPTTPGLGGSPLFRGSAYYLPVIQEDRIRFSGIPYLLAHQLFHAWNLWSFPPAELARPALDLPVASSALWLVEGLAEHYSGVSLARSRILPRAEIYTEISRNLRVLAEHPEADRMNLETASAAASRVPGRDMLEAIALKSPLAALALDVELRRASGNSFGTDSLLRWLENRPAGKFAPYDSIVGWALQAGGGPVRALYAEAIAGSKPLPHADILAAAGLELTSREVEELGLGASLIAEGDGKLVFQNVVAQGLGGRMGLRSGDRLVAVNQQPVSSDNLFPLLAVVADLRSGLRMGKPLKIRVERNGGERDLTGKLQPWKREVKMVAENKSASAAQAALREAIFGNGSVREASVSGIESRARPAKSGGREAGS
jgi:predicted metalloprotease with PDZ domain